MCPFLMDEKRKTRAIVLKVKNRLDFNSQSPPQPDAFVQCTCYTTVYSGPIGRTLEGSDKCCLHDRVNWSSFQERNLAIYIQPELQHLLLLHLL